jgi:transcription termination factor Rho
MPVLDRQALEASPLADLHAVASELSIDGFRRLRRAELITAILEKQGIDPGSPVPVSTSTPAGSGGRQSRTRAREDESDAEQAGASEAARDRAEAAADAEAADADAEAGEENDDRDGGGDSGSRRRRSRRGGRGRGSSRAEQDSDASDEEEADNGSEDQQVEGVVELLAGGSGFVRIEPPDPSDDDVYISSAQVKRCELVSGDRISGPKRAPRRSERFASLIRIETINGRPASELADSVRFDDLPAAFPSERLKVGSEDPTLKAIEWLTPFGKGSRVAIVGPPRSGKTEALRRLAEAISGHEDLTVSVVLSGARPEEISEWSRGSIPLAASAPLGSPEDAQNGAIEPVIDQARRLAARGADAVVLIDSLDGCSSAMARKALAAARNIVDGGSLTVIATASEPIGGETTLVALDLALASVGRFPAIDLVASGTLRSELLIGQAGAEAILRTRLEASDIDEE